MKKNILLVIASIFTITVKASENNFLSSIQAYQAGLYGETRGDNRPLDERLKTPKTEINFKGVTLTLLDPKVISLSGSDTGKSIELLQLKKNQSNIGLRATLIDDKMMNTSIQGLLLAVFSSDAFVRDIEQQLKNENVHFKLSGLFTQYTNKVSEFYFSVPSKKIISDFGLKQQSEKPEVSNNSEQSNRWIKYAIPFGLLAILAVWYFKYKN